MALSIGHAPWKNDTFPRSPQQTQACIIDELGENYLGLVTNPMFKSVLLEGLWSFWLWLPSWNKVNFPWGKRFSYGNSLQLRRPLLSIWFCFRHHGWPWTRHGEKVFCACWAPFLKAPTWVQCQNPRKAIQWADWHGPTLLFAHPAVSPIVVPAVWWSDHGRGLSQQERKEAGLLLLSWNKSSLPAKGDFSLALAMISGWADAIPFPGKEVLI